MKDNLYRLAATFLLEQDAKEERRNLRPWIGAVLAGMCLAVLIVAAKNVYGAEVPVHVWSDGQTTIKLMPGPCVDKVVKPFLESVGELHRFKAINSSWLYQDGRHVTHGGCWSEFSEKETGSVALFVLFFDDGDKHVVEKSEFLKKPGHTGV